MPRGDSWQSFESRDESNIDLRSFDHYEKIKKLMMNKKSIVSLLDVLFRLETVLGDVIIRFRQDGK